MKIFKCDVCNQETLDVTYCELHFGKMNIDQDEPTCKTVSSPVHVCDRCFNSYLSQVFPGYSR